VVRFLSEVRCLKILCTGDVHIGRRSTRLPSHLDGHAYSSRLAWTRVVDRALSERVDVVAIAGDLVDQANRFLEAVGSLEDGLRRLSDAGIDTLIVSGNHDFDVLPSLVDALAIPSVRLLGRRGRWERTTVERGTERLNVDGWSYPESHYTGSPLESYDAAPDGSPTLALLHADLEQPTSRYAPIRLSELRRYPETLFLLGHVHARRFVREPSGAHLLYPGSPQALDRGETGVHGITLLELAEDGCTQRSIPLSTVRYEPLDVAVDGLGTPEEVDGRLFAAARSALDSIAEGSDPLRCVRFRVRLTGATRMERRLETHLAELSGDLELSSGQVIGSIESFWLDTTPAHDLADLARGLGAPAVLADLLLTDVGDERLAGELKRVVAEVHGSRSFAEVSEGQDDLEEMERAGRMELRRAANLLLDELLRQKTGVA
jgi:predicted phosphodiesterase